MQSISLYGIAIPWCEAAQRSTSTNFFVTSTDFDETQIRLLLHLDPTMKAHHSITSWHVMVITSQVCFGITPTSDAEPTMVLRNSMHVRPPVPLLGTSAAMLYNALFQTPIGVEFESVLNDCMNNCLFCMRNFGADNAGTIDKCLTHLLRTSLPRMCTSRSVCCNHTNKIIDSAILFLGGLPIVSRLYSLSLMLRTSHYFTRVHQAIPLFVDRIQMRRGIPPAGDTAFSAEVVNFLVCQYCVDCNIDPCIGKGNRNPGSKGLQMLMDALQLLLDVFNGNWIHHILVHYCSSPQCCMSKCGIPYHRPTLLLKAIVALRFSMLNRLPSTPESGKWTCVGPCFDFVMGISAVHNMFGPLLEMAFGQLFIDVMKQARQTAENVKHTLGSEWRNDINWHELVGKRIGASLDFARSVEQMYTLWVMNVALEPLRHMTKCCLVFSRVARDR